MATAGDTSAAKARLRLRHSVKRGNPGPEQPCPTAGAGGLGRGRDPTPGEREAAMVIYTLEPATLGSPKLQAAGEINPSA